LQDLSLVGRNATEHLKLLARATLAANSGQNKPAFFPFQLQRLLSTQLLDFFA
jgi:hypothetical protein